MSVQTKEVPAALGALLKSKGQNVFKDTATVQKASATMVENPHNIEVAATFAEAPEDDIPATPEPQNPEPTDNRADGRDSPAYKELKQHYDMTVHQLRIQNEQLESKLNEAVTVKPKAPKTKEELADFRKQYPDAVDIMRTIVLEELANDGQGLKAQIDNVNKLQKELTEKEAFKKLLEEHPDALEIRQSPKFAEWYNNQSSDIQNILAKSTDIRAVADVLTLYKIKTGLKTTKEKKLADSQKREDASLGVDIKGRTEITAQKRIWTGSEINKICSNHATWKKYAAEIDEARKEGRVDMSK